jgi:hypothetical protein
MSSEDLKSYRFDVRIYAIVEVGRILGFSPIPHRPRGAWLL